jgi:hypothetical protein
MHTSTMVARTKTPLARLKCSHSMHPRARAATPMPAAHPPARGTHLGPRRDVGAVLQQRLHHRKAPGLGGFVQAGRPVLESRRAVSSGATATRAASAGGDALPSGPLHSITRTSTGTARWRRHARAPPRRRPRHASGTPAAPTLFIAAMSAPCSSSVCTTSRCPDSEAQCKLVSSF